MIVFNCLIMNFRIDITRAVLFLSILGNFIECDKQIGPDPWHNEGIKPIEIQGGNRIPADLKFTPNPVPKSNVGLEEGFFRRILALLTKAGQVTLNDDESIEVALQLRFDPEKWKTLNEYMKSNGPFTEDMYRRTMGYVQDAIYKPSLSEKIFIAWGDYVQIYLTEYKMQITWTLCILAMITGLFWCWRHISRRHLTIAAFVIAYLYEGFVSYKEAEQQEIKRFLSAIDSCKWFIWSSTCEVTPPDPLILLKHMNPLKIGIRMFTTIICEPMITISATIKIMLHGITDGLWFPFDKIAYGISIFTLNTLLVFLLIMIVFNYILNIPFNFSIFGLFNFGIKQRRRNLIHSGRRDQGGTEGGGDGDKISAVTLNRILDVCAKALDTTKNSGNMKQLPPNMSNNNINPVITRSASTGRLSDYVQPDSNLQIKYIKNRYKGKKAKAL